MLYDITNAESFAEAESIMKEIISTRKDKKTPLMLLGNKLDLEADRIVERTAGKSISCFILSICTI